MKTKTKKKVVTFQNFTRRVWNMNPVERVVPNKKKYNRKRDKNAGLD